MPVDAKTPDRFSKRYEFLTGTCRPAWVAWRCRKIRELFGQIRQALAEGRKDLRVTVTLWDETVVTNTMGRDMPQLQLYARDSMLQLYRDAGIDIDLYRDEPGLEVDRGTAESRDRGGHGNDSASAPLATQTMYRDFAYLDQPAIEACSKLDRPGAFIFNCWVEAWGDMRWYRPANDDPNAAAVAVMDGRPAEGLFGMNSAYPEDGFWWDSQLRITPAFQAGVHFLDLAQAVADLDACRITRGGLFLDKAHSQQLQQFARAYRALPRRKFITVGPSTDPVAVRTVVWDNRRYIYAVNRDYYPVNVQMVFNSTPTDAEDLAIGKKLTPDDLASFVLGPYELRSFSVGSEIEVAQFDAAPPQPIVTRLRTEAEQTLTAIAKARAGGTPVPGMDEIERGIRAALAAGWLAWLRRALASYIARRCREVAGS